MSELFVYDSGGQKSEVGLVERTYILGKIVGDFWEKIIGLRNRRSKDLFLISHFRSLISSDEKGFLLLEHLISIVVVGILSLAFLSLMQVVRVYTVDQTALTMHEVNTLAIRLQNEIRFAESLSAADGQLFAHLADGRVVSFSAQNDRLVRQVDGLGGEIMVYNLAGMDVVLFGSQSVRVSLRSFDGDVFQFYLQVLRLKLGD